ncbi:esterase-like activity of phytase family protein [Flavobacterium hiemivividum]|uniref:Esterase-like activity of phytase family protein n=1 Tax=Flavobacterium hiemivividum TaxID=2541734 RepID=A0A4R5D4M7_9FLAO|nr:esterase-like activity of phytase family protein [Flavobacterium hiemivividum]TDE06214.1 esterase-like activity of phytase family protein [Flavobacterium hiemivividum]
MHKLLIGLFSISLLFSCSNIKQATQTNLSPSLKFINSIEIPYNQNFKKTKIGGLSGIDYDKKQDIYYLISDERSQVNPSRFYTAKIHLKNDELQAIDFQETNTLKNQEGKIFGNWLSTPETSADPEDIRYNPKKKSLIWSSEGARVLSTDKNVLQNPSISFMDLKGNYQNQVTLPSNLEMQKEEKGPRNNGILEGITFDKNYKNIYTVVEEPLYDDGDKATVEKGALIRFYKFNVKTKKNTAQYTYQLEAIAKAPNPKDGFAVNGVSAIQYYSEDQLLVVERSYSVGTQACTVKVFLCDLSKATDVKDIASLQNQSIEVASKKLILNMDDLGIFIDNIEGVTFGPKLSNGKQSLLFVSDDNFSDKQKTQILLFEVE